MHITKRVFELVPPQLRFARQLGVEHIIGYLPFDRGIEPFAYDQLVEAKRKVESFGLRLTALGTPPKAIMDAILHDRPNVDDALDALEKIVIDIGRARIPVLCYSFGENWGHWRRGLDGGARGDAGVISYDHDRVPDAEPFEDRTVDADEMWRRFTRFAQRIVPVAEKANVKLACHPDDPPVPELRGMARIFHTTDALKRLIDTVPSPSNGLNFCQGVFGQAGHDIEHALRTLIPTGRVHVVHFRNVRRDPTAPVLRYDETFIDDGDMDMIASLRLYAELGYDGLIDPDHAPVMEGDAQWLRERGFAHSIGYMTAVKQMIDRE